MNAKDLIKDKGLKVTTSRIAVLEAVQSMKNHPSADQIIEKVQANYECTAIGTIYKSLETLVQHGLIRKVESERDVMRYDGEVRNHHHLIGEDGLRIEDYHDEDLDQLLTDYFKNRNIPSFNVTDIRLHIKGNFKK